MKILGDGFNIYASETGETKDKLLLSLKDYSENLSGLPVINQMDYETESIFSTFNKIAADYDKLSKIPKNPQSLISILEIAGKLIKCFCQKHRPYNILELGAEQGLLSYFLTYTARIFNRENMVHCVSENLLSNEWLLLLLEYGDAAENLNLHVTQLQTLSLQENHFDFCVINSSENEVLNNAIRLLAIGGTLVFVSQDGKVIEQKIALKEKQAAYGQSEEAVTDLRKEELKILWQQTEKKLAEIENMAREDLSRIAKDLNYLEKLAAKLFCKTEDMELKYKLNQAKENILNILYAPDEEMKKLFISNFRL
jgi:protein-L-isoaspartate O-methyltransferase